jgi:hypothetical protein
VKKCTDYVQMFFVGYGGYSHSAQRRAGGFGLTLDDWEVMGNTPLPHETTAAMAKGVIFTEQARARNN